MAIIHPMIPAYTGGGHNRECYCGGANRDPCSVTRDADSGSRGADSSSGNASSGISGMGGSTMVFDRVTGNFDADMSLRTCKNYPKWPLNGTFHLKVTYVCTPGVSPKNF